jgi:NAD(P)-dependent dehydrogenase (short-subunit alcohol dehydrogenase family)
MTKSVLITGASRGLGEDLAMVPGGAVHEMATDRRFAKNVGRTGMG